MDIVTEQPAEDRGRLRRALGIPPKGSVNLHLLVMGAFVVVLFSVAMAVVYAQQRSFESDQRKQCRAALAISQNSNELLQSILTSAATNSSRTPQENAEALRRYSGIRFPDVPCP